MKTTNNKPRNSSEVRAEQVAKRSIQPPVPTTPTVQPEAIYLGLDLHKHSMSITRIIDHSTAQPAQRLNWEQAWRFIQKQLLLAKKVYAVYEAGAFGFWVCRKLQDMGVACFVVHPEKLDPHHKRVQTDQLDSRNLADKLQRYVLGNRRAMVVVYVPTEPEERRRLPARHRGKLQQQLQALERRGQGLLLSQGIFETKSWWREWVWKRLQPKLCPELLAVLEDYRALIAELEKRLAVVEKTLEDSAPNQLPKGLGRLTFALLSRELCNFERFRNRRNVGGFTGLCGAVSSSGPYHLDLSINKAGSAYLRTLLVELAWRVVYWQRDYRGLQRWKQLLPLGRAQGSKRSRKIAIVAVARQLGVDIWRWQTGKLTAQQLGWKMSRF